MDDLGFWMAMFTFGALAYYCTPLGRLIQAAARSLWGLIAVFAPVPEHPDQPRDRMGRWASTDVTSTGNGQERPLPPVTQEVTALGSEVTSGNAVTTEVTIDEAIFITAHLVQGVAPSNVIKQLPGFTPKHYDRSKAKVDQVKEILAEQAEEGITPSA